jgi:ATP-dependent RNA/DNA helicase IGHMBP2
VTGKTVVQGPAERVREVLFGRATPHFGSVPAVRQWKAVNRHLNAAQLEAIDFALAASDLALIHGPPGTGKTTTVVELIVQCVKAGQKVLATAPSNIAVDNLTERLAAAGVRIVRLGHPARVLPSVIDSTLDVQVEQSEGKSLANDARCEINQALRKLSKKGASKGGAAQDASARKAERSSLRRELTALRKEVREREHKAVEQIMGGAQVVLCTNAGAALRDVEAAGDFDVCVIDEAAMALEVSCWIPILKAKKLVLAGDHCQLSPPVMSKQAEAQGLGTTLFDRVLSLYGDECVRMLTIQYRMHRDISDWRSCRPLCVPRVPAARHGARGSWRPSATCWRPRPTLCRLAQTRLCSTSCPSWCLPWCLPWCLTATR